MFLCFWCSPDICDVSSASVSILHKCPCWLSKAKQSIKSYSLSSICSYCFGCILPQLLFCWYWRSLHMSLHPGHYVQHFCFLYFAVSPLWPLTMFPYIQGYLSSLCPTTTNHILSYPSIKMPSTMQNTFVRPLNIYPCLLEHITCCNHSK